MGRPGGRRDRLHDQLAGMPLVDHHCHGVVSRSLDRAGVDALLTEAPGAGPAGTSPFDSLLGVAVRRWCAPVLDLPAHAHPDDYLQRRRELGGRAVARRLLAATGASDLLLDVGLRAGDVLGPDEMAEVSGARTHRVVRLEAVAEEVAASGTTGADFAAAFEEALTRHLRGAVAAKSIAAYRGGLDLDPRPPGPAEVQAAACRWLATGHGGGGRFRLQDPVLLRHLIWAAARRRLPLQIHTGFGDPDLHLSGADPLHLTALIRALAPTGTTVLLLHCYPFHREAAYLASVYPHVAMDIGLAIPYVGARAAAVLAEALELAPFHKLLYASDGFGLPELHHLGAALFRRALEEVLDPWVRDGEMGRDDACRLATMVASGNARRVYAIE